MKYITALFLIYIVTAAGAAIAADPRCEKLAAAYDQGERRAAMIWSDGSLDNSAPRATMRELKIQNTLIERQMNLSMMIALQCPLPQDPANASGAYYLLPAIECMSVGIGKDASKAPECDMATWKRHSITK